MNRQKKIGVRRQKRVRSKLRVVGNGRPRLSIFRSSKN
ncbi:MAG: 50S ribosomal protein L18, partial [Alphaproteobacteria bacterium]|nr:50S ribosomal protein L18 [Alphaproteobacteria bacterium]